MGLWLKANRTLAEIIAAGVFCLVLVALWMYHDHVIAQAATVKCEERVSVPASVAILQQQLSAKDLEITRLEAAKVEADALAQIPLRPVTRPVWVCPDALRAGNAAGRPRDQNGGAPAGAGATVPGSRYDAGPAIDRFKARYETVIEQARAALAECPTVTVLPLD